MSCRRSSRRRRRNGGCDVRFAYHNRGTSCRSEVLGGGNHHPGGRIDDGQELDLPADAPQEIQVEFREAETCARVKAYRAAGAMARSTLEKALIIAGYKPARERLVSMIREAVAEGILGEVRRSQADSIRDLGNEVLHDPWRPVDKDEAQAILTYAHRVIHDLFSDWNTVRAVLVAKGRQPTV